MHNATLLICLSTEYHVESGEMTVINNKLVAQAT